jgi:bifunctional UDP-N-acetylglucosamine pyrophosphorylase/glucosamine-1-phosphate N-acetyltransferase
MDIYIVAMATKYTQTKAYDVALRDIIYENFKGVDFIKVDNASAVKEGGITAVVYEDTPFVTPALLKDLEGRIDQGLADAFKIGQGYIKRKGATLKGAEAVPVLRVDSFRAKEEAAEILRNAILEKHFENGVEILDAKTTYIGFRVQIGKGTVIHPMNYLKGDTCIGKNVIVNSFNDLTDTRVGDKTDITASYALSSTIGNECLVGPYATFRKGAVVKDRCRVGNYVEIKNSVLEADVKAAHLAYVGDSFVGENTNIGCGVVFANYDGVNKHSVHVGKNVFIGCNTNLVAPLTVEENAFIAAGSTVTQDVPTNSLCIARARQTIKSDWKPKS